ASVRDLLQYPLQSAGRIMTERFVSVTASMTAAQVIMHLRRVASDVEMVNDIYVLNGGKRLEGVVSLRSVITAPQNAVVGNFMTTDVITVSPETDREEVARLVARYDFLAMPVVAPNGRLLGIITVDDVIDVLVEK
ncbi:MAG: CBS domain-containing protein, partial [Anaerolineae bacterium]|nr:CBS domain-containing protein [Anaerolineae bacterium]